MVNLLHEGLLIAESGPTDPSGVDVRPRAAADHLTSMGPMLEVRELRKDFATPRGLLSLFEGLNFEIAPGEMTAIVGESGSGKSTLLHLMAALDVPTSGSVFFNGTDLASLSSGRAATYRNRELGYVWQMHYLLPEFTALENAAMPLLARGVKQSEALEQAAHWLQQVELQDRGSHRAGELSGGEQQRVALARALITRPKLLLADEPTGDLDNRTGENVFNLVRRLHTEHGLTSVLVTHNEGFAQRCDRVLRLQAGRIIQSVVPQSSAALVN
jgi:lipoprotein-releasing system ATP-binding protein